MTFKIFVFPTYPNMHTHTYAHAKMGGKNVCQSKQNWDLSPYFSRQCCLPGDDGWSIFLGRDVWQSGPQTVPPHLHVHEWLLRLPLIFCPGIWRLSPLPSCRRLWVSLVTWSQFCGRARAARHWFKWFWEMSSETSQHPKCCNIWTLWNCISII